MADLAELAVGVGIGPDVAVRMAMGGAQEAEYAEEIDDEGAQEKAALGQRDAPEPKHNSERI
jgi:hypothetical protein